VNSSAPVLLPGRWLEFASSTESCKRIIGSELTAGRCPQQTGNGLIGKRPVPRRQTALNVESELSSAKTGLASSEENVATLGRSCETRGESLPSAAALH
jgi:hypothetical protein